MTQFLFEIVLSTNIPMITIIILYFRETGETDRMEHSLRVQEIKMEGGLPSGSVSWCVILYTKRWQVYSGLEYKLWLRFDPQSGYRQEATD